MGTSLDVFKCAVGPEKVYKTILLSHKRSNDENRQKFVENHTMVHLTFNNKYQKVHSNLFSMSAWQALIFLEKRCDRAM